MLRVSRSQTTQNVFGDLFSVQLPLVYNPGPVGGRGGKHEAGVGINPHSRRAVTQIILRILSPFRTKPRGPEDHEGLRRTIIITRNCKTASVRPIGNRRAVAFVPDQGVIGSEDLTVPQASALENPVIGMLHPIANGLAPAPPLPAAVAVANAGQAVFRIKPEPLVPLLVPPGQHGFITDKGGAAL